MPNKQRTLAELISQAQGYADYAMRSFGRVPPALMAESPGGRIHFLPNSFNDESAKDSFASTARLICAGYQATAAVLVLEAWLKIAKHGEKLDLTEMPSEAFDRQEVVIITGESAQYSEQRLLRIVRTDAGGFWSLVELGVPKMDSYQGRFAQLLPPKRLSAPDRELAKAMLATMGITAELLQDEPGEN